MRKRKEKAVFKTKCYDCGFKHGPLGIVQVDYGVDGEKFSVPITHCTGIKILLFKGPLPPNKKRGGK